ncbi:hypothetical protein [Streptomyces sp. enrichment culture]|uniref:hypothetical protein n=1 Tax=Streptomyces sp. enrichment culture TaxID=1795815 RepID=UPI003F57BD36
MADRRRRAPGDLLFKDGGRRADDLEVQLTDIDFLDVGYWAAPPDPARCLRFVGADGLSFGSDVKWGGDGSSLVLTDSGSRQVTEGL